MLNAVANLFAGVVSGFVPGDEIDIAAATLTGAALGTDGVLVLSDDGASVASVDLAGNFAGEVFQLVPDGVDGTLVRLANTVATPAPCYAAGTRILTAQGERAVEDLRAGDLVVALRGPGGLRPVRWVGWRRIDIARHPRPELVLPVRVRRGAFGAGMPHRDLRLSPEHAVFVNGVLIPVHLLVNGATVVREAGVAEVTYWHVELDQHDILLAEGLPAESYLDTGNRDDFRQRRADGSAACRFGRAGCGFVARLGGEGLCRIGATRGRGWPSVVRMLADRAVALGWRLTAEPDLRIVAGGVGGSGRNFDGGVYRFALPREARGLRLVSRRAVPAECNADCDDHRRLGVAVQEIAADGVALKPSGGGWYAPPEREWRWTDGDAVLDCPGARLVTVRVAPILRYWVAAEAVRSGRLAVR